MSPSTGIGLYPGSATAVENDQVSSTGEGRHLTFLEANITGHEHTWPTKGHPVVVGEHIVGVVLAITRTDGTIGAAANAVDDLIAIDTEGIFNLMVYATDELGDVAVAAGDELYIDRDTALISKNNNKNTHTLIGYALGIIGAGSNYVIAVKVHWNPDDGLECVGQDDALFTSDREAQKFREYYYAAGGGGVDITGERMELTITAPCVTAFVDYKKLIISNDPTVVTGRCAVQELRLEVTDGGVLNLPQFGILSLDFNNDGSASFNNYVGAFIQLRDRSAVEGDEINHLFNMYQMAPNNPFNTDVLFSISQDTAMTHTLKFTASGIKYYIMCTTTVPF